MYLKPNFYPATNGCKNIMFFILKTEVLNIYPGNLLDSESHTEKKTKKKLSAKICSLLI